MRFIAAACAVLLAFGGIGSARAGGEPTAAAKEPARPVFAGLLGEAGDGEDRAALTLLFGPSSKAEVPALRVEQPALAEALTNPALTSPSRSGQGTALALIRRSPGALRLLPGEGEVLWLTLDVAADKFAIRGAASGPGTLSLRVQEVADPASPGRKQSDGEADAPRSFFIHVDRKGSRITESVRDRREKTHAEHTLAKAMTGQWPFELSVTPSALGSVVGAGESRVSLTVPTLRRLAVMVAVGARDGAVALRGAELEFTASGVHWKARREHLAARAVLEDLRVRGVFRASGMAAAAITDSARQHWLGQYPEDQAKARLRREFAKAAVALPDNVLAQYEYAESLVGQGDLVGALDRLRPVGAKDPGVAAFAASLALRLDRAEEVLSLAPEPVTHRGGALLRGLALARSWRLEESEMLLARAANPEVKFAHGDSMVAARAALLVEGVRAIRSLVSRSPAAGPVRVLGDTSPGTMQAVAVAAKAVEQVLPGGLGAGGWGKTEVLGIRNPVEFVGVCLVLAHQRADQTGALYMQPAGDHPGRVFVCTSMPADELARSLRHELTHAALFAARVVAAKLPWLNEGAAVMVSAAGEAGEDGEVEVGLPREAEAAIPVLVQRLRGDGAGRELRDLFRLDGPGFYAPGLAEGHYAMSWALVWYAGQPEAEPALGALLAGEVNPAEWDTGKSRALALRVASALVKEWPDAGDNGG